MSFERFCELVERQKNARQDFLDYNYYQASLRRDDFEIEHDVRCSDGKAVITIKTCKAAIWGDYE